MVVIIKSELGEMKNTKKLQADPVNVKTATRQLGITVQSIIVVCVLLSLQLCS